MKRAFCILSFACYMLASCTKPAAPIVQTATNAATGACSLVSALGSNGTLSTICATVDEIAQIVAFVTTLRTSPAPNVTCEPLPGTTFCASPDEVTKAIGFVLEKRRARYLLGDGGAT